MAVQQLQRLSSTESVSSSQRPLPSTPALIDLVGTTARAEAAGGPMVRLAVGSGLGGGGGGEAAAAAGEVQVCLRTKAAVSSLSCRTHLTRARLSCSSPSCPAGCSGAAADDLAVEVSLAGRGVCPQQQLACQAACLWTWLLPLHARQRCMLCGC